MTEAMDMLGIDLREVRAAALSGRLSVGQLLDIIAQQQRAIQSRDRELERLKERLAQYEPEVRREGMPKTADPATSSESFSMEAEAKRRRGGRRRKKSPGRRPSSLKFADADRTQDVYPDGVRRRDCRLVRERAVWRLEQGRAVRVGYRIHAGPDGHEPRIPGWSRPTSWSQRDATRRVGPLPKSVTGPLYAFAPGGQRFTFLPITRFSKEVSHVFHSPPPGFASAGVGTLGLRDTEQIAARGSRSDVTNR